MSLCNESEKSADVIVALADFFRKLLSFWILLSSTTFAGAAR